MTKEKDLFTVSEDEKTEKEIIAVSENEEKVAMPMMQYLEEEGPKEEEDDGDWRTSKKPEHFIVFLVTDFNRIPNPSEVMGTKSEAERTLSQYKRLDADVSQALRLDYDGTIDIKKVDEMRRQIEANIDALEDALDGIEMMKKQRKKMRRRRATNDPELTKEAGTPHFNGMQMVITPFQRAIAGSLINGKVSGGRDMEQLYEEAKKKYAINEREELELLQILADMGYPIFKDRLAIGDSNDPTRDKDHGEWQSQYYA